MGLPALAADTGTSPNDTCDGTLTGCDGFYYTDAEGTSWTVQGLRKVSDDLSLNGTTSKYYEQFHRNLDTTATPMNDDGSVNDSKGMICYNGTDTCAGKLDSVYNGGDAIEFRLIGINHDVKADGTGKAGLTFMTFNTLVIPDDGPINDVENPGSSAGEWRDSLLRKRYNQTEIPAKIPPQIKKNLQPIIKTNISSQPLNETPWYLVDSVNSTVDTFYPPSLNEIFTTPVNYDSANNYQYEWFAKDKLDVQFFTAFKLFNNITTKYFWPLRTFDNQYNQIYILNSTLNSANASSTPYYATVFAFSI